MCGVVLEHVSHVRRIDERIIDADDFDVVASCRNAECQTANAPETVDTNLDSHGRKPFSLTDSSVAPINRSFAPLNRSTWSRAQALTQRAPGPPAGRAFSAPRRIATLVFAGCGSDDFCGICRNWLKSRTGSLESARARCRCTIFDFCRCGTRTAGLQFRCILQPLCTSRAWQLKCE